MDRLMTGLKGLDVARVRWLTRAQVATVAAYYGYETRILLDTDDDGVCNGAYACNVESKLRARGES